MPSLTLKELGHTRQEVPPQRGQRLRYGAKAEPEPNTLPAGVGTVPGQPAGNEVVARSHAQRSMTSGVVLLTLLQQESKVVGRLQAEDAVVR